MKTAHCTCSVEQSPSRAAKTSQAWKAASPGSGGTEWGWTDDETAL